MKHRSWSIATVVGVVATAVVFVSGASAHPNVDPGLAPAPPSAAFSTSGDYASDVLGDPWDFNNDEDVPPIMTVGTEGSYGISRDPSGWLTLDGKNGSIVKLVRTWGAVLPWGHDGLLRPIDASIYTRLSFRVNVNHQRDMLVRFMTSSGQFGTVYMGRTNAGTGTYNVDLTQPDFPSGGPSHWSGQIIRLDLLAGGSRDGTPDRFTMQLDWVSLHRADTQPPDAFAPQVVKLTSPSEEGGADYATVSGNAWDFTGPDDVVTTGDLVINSYANGEIAGTTIHNDSFVELPLRTPLITDRYHRATAEVCYGGDFRLDGLPGGGMNARFAWFDEGGQIWSETQDIVIYPGCNRMTIDLTTSPPGAVNDEGTIYKAGWRGLRITALRFDLNEDPGARAFWLRDIRLADDATLASGTFPISFDSTSAGTADVFVSTTPGDWGGTKVASAISVGIGSNTFNWNGTGLPNGTYWVHVTVHSGNSFASSYSTGPVRIEKPQPPTPSCYVPLNPARLLDTRTGQGGNISGLAATAMTELNVAGVGGVPPTGATAVVLNVTADAPITSGYVTAWPSGEDQPPVSNLNYFPGQTVPNLVTVKIGANGRVNLFNSTGFTQVVADVVGYYTAATAGCTGRFTAVTPGRVLDTRNGTGHSGAVGPGQAINVTVTGLQGVPTSGVSGVALNVTADSPTAPGYLTVWPTGEAQPGASSHNFVPGLTVANLVLAKVGTGGQVSIFNSAGFTHVVADVVGYFSASGGVFVPLSPQRIVDSRYGIGRGVGGLLGGGQTINVDVAGVGGVPSNATAAIVNVTSTDSATPSFITVWPAGDPMPTASTLNPRPGVAVPNLAYLKLRGGQLAIYNNAGSTNYIVDVFGYVV